MKKLNTSLDQKFPFFGAGDASYFEWASIQIIFHNEPNEDQKKQIEKTVPVPINELSWEKNVLSAGSGQFAHVDIASNYETKDGSDPGNPEDWEDDRWFFAADSQVTLFNKDIERWLIEIHEISSILLAFRAEDFESGGTEFSDWHHKSMNELDLILAYFDDLIDRNIHDSLKSEVFKNILWMKKEGADLDEKHLEYLYPGKKEIEAFFKDDIFPLKNAALKGSSFMNSAVELLNETFNIDNKEQRQLFNKYSDELITLKESVSEYEFEELCNHIWNAAYKEKDQSTMKKVPKTQDLIASIAYEAYQKILQKDFEESISLFDDIVTYKSNDLSMYCNALYVLQNDNTGLPVNPDLNNKFIKASLPYACHNPAIFYNTACLYVEMKEYENAYDMIKKAVDHQFDGYESMKFEILNEDFFKKFRESTEVIKLLK